MVRQHDGLPFSRYVFCVFFLNLGGEYVFDISCFSFPILNCVLFPLDFFGLSFFYFCPGKKVTPHDAKSNSSGAWCKAVEDKLFEDSWPLELNGDANSEAIDETLNKRDYKFAQDMQRAIQAGDVDSRSKVAQRMEARDLSFPSLNAHEAEVNSKLLTFC